MDRINQTFKIDEELKKDQEKSKDKNLVESIAMQQSQMSILTNNTLGINKSQFSGHTSKTK